MKSVVIVYESVYGNTRKLAEAISEGIMMAEDIKCDITRTSGIHTDDLSRYDAILFGCPNHNQEPAANMVKFIERAAIVELGGKKGALFDTYTGGNEGVAVKKLESIVREKMPGIDIILEGFSAEVKDRKGPLVADEISRAREFGEQFGMRLLE